MVDAPPGSGKTTFVTLARQARIRAVDLESAAPDRESRHQVLNALVADARCTGPRLATIVGAADLGGRAAALLATHRPTLLIAVILPDQATYDARRRDRDALLPGKASQGAHSVASWARNYDAVSQAYPGSVIVVRGLTDLATLACLGLTPEAGGRLIAAVSHHLRGST